VKKYGNHIGAVMSNDLGNLWNKLSLFIYNSPEGKELRNSESVEENAQFLVKWAAELFGDWAAWMNQILPGCVVSYKKSTLSIANKIKSLGGSRPPGPRLSLLPGPDAGWRKLTDMLRGSYICTSAEEVMDALG